MRETESEEKVRAEEEQLQEAIRLSMEAFGNILIVYLTTFFSIHHNICFSVK